MIALFCLSEVVERICKRKGRRIPNTNKTNKHFLLNKLVPDEDIERKLFPFLKWM